MKAPATTEASASGIPDALKNFSLLPDDAHVRQHVVQSLFACSRTTVWRMVKRGTLPAPKKLSERVTAWNVGDLRKSLSSIGG
jgi:predicted DNA-binding transcriptional regulator AlpA